MENSGIRTISHEIFEKTYVPYFKEHQLKHSFIQNRKAYNKNANLFSIYAREYVPHYTFIEYDGRVYHLSHELRDTEFVITGTNSPCCKILFTPDHFQGVSPSLIGVVPLVQNPDVVLVPTQSPAEEPALFDSRPGIPLAQSPVIQPLYYLFPEIGSSEGFDQFIEERLERIKNTILVKGKQYRRKGNPFHNFDSVGQMNEVIPERALWDMVSKQIINLRDIVQDIESGILPDKALLYEVSNDIRVYMFLLEGVILRRIDQTPQQAA